MKQMQSLKGRSPRYVFLMVNFVFLVTFLHTGNAVADPGRLTLGARISEHLNEGYTDVLVPLGSSERDILFLNPKFSATDGDEEEISAGFGFRHLFPSPGFILGANLYYDSRTTAYNNRFDQVGAGLELLTAWVDVRANYYRPEDDREPAGEYQYQKAQTSTSSAWGDPFAAEHEIRQTLSLRSVTTTTTRFFEKNEIALEGYDAEIGLRLPVLSGLAETRVFGGFYHFGRTFDEDIEGLKTRLEIRTVPALIFDVEVYEDDELTGSDYFVGGRLQVPFDVGNLFTGGNLFEGFRDAFKRRKPEPATRLSEMVIRDLHVRTEQSGFIENAPKRTVENKVKKSKQTITLLDDINFVDGDNTNGVENGTAKHPYNTAQEGVDNALGARHVYVFDASSPYNENVRLTEKASLIGGGQPVAGRGGRVFGGDRYPTIDGRSLGPAVEMAGESEIGGLHIINTEQGGPDQLVTIAGYNVNLRRLGIWSSNANDVVIANTTVDTTQAGVILAADHVEDFRFDVTGNYFGSNEDAGMWILGQGGSGESLQTRITENAFMDNANVGLQMNVAGYDAVDISVENNDFFRNASDAMEFNVTAQHEVHLQLQHLNIQDNPGHGVDANIQVADGAAVIEAYHILGYRNGGSVLDVEATVTEGVTGLFENMSLTDNTGSGISAAFYGSGNHSASFSGIEANENGSDGIAFYGVTLSGNVTALFEDIEGSGNGGNGVSIFSSTENDITLSLRHVAANGNDLGDGGIRINAQSASGNIDTRMDTVQANSNRHHGFYVELEAPGSVSADFSTVEAKFTQGLGTVPFGIFFTIDRADEEAGIIFNHADFSQNTDYGMMVLANVTGAVSAVFSDINVDDNELGTGLDFLGASETKDLSLVLEDIHASGGFDAGVSIQAFAKNDISIFADTIIAHETAFDYSSAVNISANSDAGDVFLWADHFVTQSNGGNGVLFGLNAWDGNLDIVLNGFDARDNKGNGGILVEAFAPNGMADLSIGNIFAQDNAGWGLEVLLSAQKDVSATISSVLATGNGANGSAALDVNLDSEEESVAVEMDNMVSRFNNNAGLSMDITAFSNTIRAALTDSIIQNNGDDGVHADLAAGTEIALMGERNMITGNHGDGVDLNVSSAMGTTPAVDFGGGALGMQGQNSIYGQADFAGFYDFSYSGAGTAAVQSNWWGSATPAAGQFNGAVDYSRPLPVEPGF